MKKIMTLLLALILLVCSLTACTQRHTNQLITSDSTRTIVDMSGNEVLIPKKIDNYAVVFAGDFDLVAMLDGCEHMSAFSETVLKYEHVTKAYPELKNKIALPRRNVSIESIVDSGAQVVILRENDYPELSEQLKKIGIPVVDLNFENFDELKKCVTIFSEIMNTPEIKEKAKKYNDFLDSEVAFAKEFKVSHNLNNDITVLALRDADALETYSPDRMMGAWADACGFKYCLESTPDNQNIKLTPEQMIEYDPDYVLFSFSGNADKFLKNEKLATLTSVKEHHVYQSPTVFNPFIVNGVEVALQMRWMYSVVYSDLIDYDMSQVVKEFYSEFFDYELDDETLKTILEV